MNFTQEKNLHYSALPGCEPLSQVQVDRVLRAIDEVFDAASNEKNSPGYVQLTADEEAILEYTKSYIKIQLKMKVRAL